jgi:DNA-binding NarL/FixJ family response regulator
MKFALVEDQVMFRNLLRRMLVESRGGDIVIECGTLAELRAQSALLRTVDLLLLDIRLPDGDGVAFVEELTTGKIGVPVLLLSASTEDFVIHRVSRSFVQGFVHKDDPTDHLLTAIDVVVGGGSYFSPRFRAKLAEMARLPANFLKVLSPREQQLLKLLGAGYSDSEVASSVGLSMKTVETHRYNIMSKLDLHSAQQLQAYALKAGFTSVGELHS